MPGLFGIYSMANRALMTFQSAISVIGHNVSNAGTEGFHRQRVGLRAGLTEQTPVGLLGTGVRVETIQRVEDRFIELAVQREVPLLSRYSVRADSLARSELVFGEPSERGLTAQLDDFYTGWDDLASNPEDPAARESVVRLGMSLSGFVRDARQRLADQQSSISGEVVRAVDDANRIIHELERLNRNILAATRDGVVPADMEDRRDHLVEALGDLMGATAQVETNGTATVRMGGRVLVQEEASQTFAYDPFHSKTPTLDGKEFREGDLDGRIGGLLEVRDRDLSDMLRRLDEFAVRLARDVNDIHAQGKDLNGAAALPFFVLVGVARDGVEGAAGGLAINPDLVEDSTLVAAGSDGTAGNNSIALDIAALRSDRSGAADMLHALVVSAASRAREAEDVALGQEVIVQSFRAQREAISGVSLDEEASNLLRFQRSYQAAARIMTVADEMTQTLLSF